MLEFGAEGPWLAQHCARTWEEVHSCRMPLQTHSKFLEDPRWTASPMDPTTPATARGRHESFTFCFKALYSRGAYSYRRIGRNENSSHKIGQSRKHCTGGWFRHFFLALSSVLKAYPDLVLEKWTKGQRLSSTTGICRNDCVYIQRGNLK